MKKGIDLLKYKEDKQMYYEEANVPTFTYVTGIEERERTYSLSAKSNVYVYKCSNSQKFAFAYMVYLKEHGFTILDVYDDCEDMFSLVNEDSGVVVIMVNSTDVNVVPYKRKTDNW